jgi:hypothetical protein
MKFNIVSGIAIIAMPAAVLTFTNANPLLSLQVGNVITTEENAHEIINNQEITETTDNIDSNYNTTISK